MSDVYVQEPRTHGRVLIKTNKGDLLVELWSRECPKACRNFVQLCEEGYYNGCIFHRIIPDFIVQTGDPSGSGTTCESVYGEPFVDEIHSRLRYRYRGMIGAASAGKDTNGSQFFLTLAKQDMLNGKNTLFGKLVGDSIYSLTNIASVEVDRNDRPIGDFVPMILETVVLENPFPDIVPRSRKPAFEISQKLSLSRAPVKKEAIAAKRSKVLSFEDDDDDDDDNCGRIVSAHDALKSDKSLSSQTGSLERVVPERTVVEKPEVVISRPPVAQQPKAVEIVPSGENDKIQEEIERLQAAINASSSESTSKRPHKDPEDHKQDEHIVKKLKLWAQSVSSKSGGALTSAPSKRDTLHALISTAEKSVDSVSGSSWLQSAGSVKFGIDSRRAFESPDLGKK